MRKLIVILLFAFANSLLSQSDTNQIIQEIFIEETQPSFPGGEAKFYSFIELVKCYPDSVKSRGVEGKVFIQFVVKKTGELSDIKILRSPDTLLSKESIRIVKSMPKWNPGKNFQGDSVDVRMSAPILFRLNDEPIFRIVKSQPEFPGGNQQLFEYLSKNIKITESKHENGVKSKFYFEFVVEKDGSLSNLKMIRNYNEEFYKHIVQVFNNMPKWKPGMQNGKPVRAKMVIPLNITFR